MANDLNNLLDRVERADRSLAAELRKQISALSKRREFGLNFEKHKPETVELHGRTVRAGDKVRILNPRGQTGPREDERTWRVQAIKKSGSGTRAQLLEVDGEDERTSPIDELVVIADFRDPIYPGLRPTGAVHRGGDTPHHVVINAENFHALEALRFTCQGRVDLIYCDSPYNTRDNDWKYNNDYVDSDDDYKHSKWLSFMERRLKIARQLLNPDGSVLIATIDEKEYLRLGLLLEQTFPGARIQMVSSVINRKGVPRKREFSRVDEYLFFVMIGTSGPSLAHTDMLSTAVLSGQSETVGWVGLRRRGSEWRRSDRPGSFSPIFVDETTGQIVSFGDSLPLETDRATVPDRPGQMTIWPLNSKGEESRWQLSPDTARELLATGYLRTGFQRGRKGLTMEYLSDGQRRQIEDGTIEITGRDENGAVIAVHVGNRLQQAKTIWNRDSHGATAYGTQMVSALLPGRPFPYPKSLYAVEDALRFFIGEKPDALVLDYFAGSGTTAHAVMRLNRQDGGRRRSIMVTNNEVSAVEEMLLRRQGHRPGDPEWERLGICEQITKPRVEAAMKGHTPSGSPVRGAYKFTDPFPIAEGFEQNVDFFTLTYEDPRVVGADLTFEAIAPLLWMRAGSQGSLISERRDTFEVADTYGVLFSIDSAGAFTSAIAERSAIRVAFIVTDDEKQFQRVSALLPSQVETVRLYESYLRTFEINIGKE
jgi:adenine-specific DNA-methyltransferase